MKRRLKKVVYLLLIYFQIPVHMVYIIKIYKYVIHVTMLLYWMKFYREMN